MLPLLGLLWALNGTALAEAGRLFIVGSSETAGYGVPKDASYPALLGRRCRRPVMVSARIAFPVLLSPPPRLRRGDALVLFISYNDLFQLEPEWFDSELRTWFDTMAGGPNRLVVLPPPASGQRVWEIYGISKPDALARERLRWNRVTAVARRRHVAVLRLTTVDGTYLQRDGLHPNQKGHRELARQIAGRLQICSQ